MRVGDLEGADCLYIVAIPGPEPDLNREPPLAFNGLADDLPTQGRDRVEHVVGVDPVAGDPVAIDLDPQEREPPDHLGPHSG